MTSVSKIALGSARSGLTTSSPAAATVSNPFRATNPEGGTVPRGLVPDGESGGRLRLARLPERLALSISNLTEHGWGYRSRWSLRLLAARLWHQLIYGA